jgi:glucokinase
VGIINVLAVDIGSTKVRLAVVSLSGDGDTPALMCSSDLTTSGCDLSAVLVNAASCAQSLVVGLEYAGIGISTAGFLHSDRATISQLHDGHWIQTNVNGPFEAALGIKPRVLDDGMAAAFAEWKSGAAQGCSDAVVLTVGTKIGTGVILGGRLACVGGYASPQLGGVVVPQSLARNPATPFLGEEAAGDALRFFAEQYGFGDVANMIYSSDLDCRATEAVDHVCEYLAICVANAINLFAPERVVVTGGVIGKSGRLLVRRVRTRIVGKLLQRPSPFCAETALVEGKFGGMAGIFGAALAVGSDPLA